MEKCGIAVCRFPCDGPDSSVYNASLRSISNYASRIGIPVEIIESRLFPSNLPLHVEKFQIANLLNRYDRILYLDLDILINPAAPNIFDVHKKTDICVMGLEEGQYTDVDAAFFERKYNVVFPFINGHRRVINSGVLLLTPGVIPALTLDINNFTRSFGNGTWGGEQMYFNMNLCRYNITVDFLDSKWNWLLFESEPMNRRSNAWFVHYASSENKQLLLSDNNSLWR